MKYRVLKYLTLTGTFEVVSLSMFSNGEWIIYDGKIPKFHISCFDEDSESDTMIKDLLEIEKWSIEIIIERINKSMNLNLNFGKSRPWFEIIISSKLLELNLKPIPVKWIEEIKNKNGS